MYKKVLSLLTASVFLMSALVFVPVQGIGKTNPAPTAKISQSGPVDLGVANDEKLIKMLKKQGKISLTASPGEATKILQDYLNKKVTTAEKSNGYSETNKTVQTPTITNSKATKNVPAVKTVKKGQPINGVAPAEPVTYNGTVKKDNILVLLIDFPNYLHNSMTTADTDLYYSDYTSAHFAEMMFGANGYKGPSGQTLISMKQYYQQQSGGSYTVDGEVSQWFTALKPAAYYGGNALDEDGVDTGGDLQPRELVMEALTQAVASGMDLSKFDENGDMVLDHIMVMHSGAGEEAGGGALGNNAIWSHSWGWDDPIAIPGTDFTALNYTIQPEDAAAGVCCHEFGHDLGLPDEYDTAYSSSFGGEPIEYWSIMSSGSWGGVIPGTEPTGFSPYGKAIFQNLYGGNWLTGTTLNYTNITAAGTTVKLDQATTKGTNEDVVRIDLPSKERIINAPYAGGYSYYSGKGNDIERSMMLNNIVVPDLVDSSLSFKLWYAIETDYDYGYIQVREDGTTDWTTIETLTGFSEGWETREIPLNAYANKTMEVRFLYTTDGGWIEAGMFLDDITINNGTTTVTYNAEGTSEGSDFDLGTFTRNNGKVFGAQYYLLEWRNQQGVDTALGHILRGTCLMSYDPGLVVWFVDETYDDNMVGIHPGEGYLGIVDAGQDLLLWKTANKHNTGTQDKYLIASARYQMHDAAFSINRQSQMSITYPATFTLTDNQVVANPSFIDGNKYINDNAPDFGKLLTPYGLKFTVTGESTDRSAATILITRTGN